MRQLTIAALSASALCVASCTAIGADTASPTTIRAKSALQETVVLKSWPCFWRTCPGYTLTLTPDDRVELETFEATPFIGVKKFETTAEEANRFRKIVNQYRPERNLDLNSKPMCREMWSDQSGVSVSWQDSGAENVHLDYYGGCDPKKYRVMARDLWSAYEAIPALVPLIKKPQSGDEAQ